MWNQRRRPVAVDLKPEIPGAHAHACPLEFLQGANLRQGRNLANGVVIVRNRLVAVLNLLQQVAPGQIIQLLRRPENGHVAQRLRQYFVVGVKEGVRTVHLAVPQQVYHQENVLWRVEVEVAPHNGLSDGCLLPHLHRDQAPAGNGHAHRVGRQPGSGVDAPHLGIPGSGIGRKLLLFLFLRLVVFVFFCVASRRRIVILSQLEKVKLRPVVSQPIFEPLVFIERRSIGLSRHRLVSGSFLLVRIVDSIRAVHDTDSPASKQTRQIIIKMRNATKFLSIVEFRLSSVLLCSVPVAK
mmetsp:Transcript_5825/g.16602  ORF Transcript_5825/g.16602 Transcript_5825/m.16602 type:complete len:296 (+) Transcript_5825:1666-2553(+)